MSDSESIVNTYNIFVDTSRGHTADSQGDNFHLNLGHAGIVCDAGQYLRLNLNNFSMYKTFTDINDSNNKFSVRVGTTSTVGSLTKRNNTTLNALATDFATQFASAFKTSAALGGSVTVTPSDITPNSTSTIGGDSNHVISFKLTTSTAHGASSALCQFFSSDGDSFEILGGNRIEDTANTTTSSISITFPSTTTVQVTCLYPAQRQSISYIYLKASGLPNTSIETIGLSHPTDTHRTDTTDSDILAKIPCDTEYITYDAQSGREYFMNVRQKVVSNLRLRLTDRHNRPLGRGINSSSKTASGSGTEQSTLGNLSFSAVIRVDVIQQRHIKELETKPTINNTAERFDKVLSQPKFGRNAYGSGPGR